MLSPYETCMFFDSRANSYVNTNAVGTLLLESDLLLGVCRGYVRLLGLSLAAAEQLVGVLSYRLYANITNKYLNYFIIV